MEQHRYVARNATALLLAVIAQGFVFYLIEIGPRTRYRAESTNDWRGELFFVTPNATLGTTKHRRPASARRESSGEGDKEPIDRMAMEELDQQPIDWNAVATSAISKVLQEQQLQHGYRSLDSKPRVLELAKSKNGVRKRGDTQRFDDGEVITWISAECYATNRPDGPPTKNANEVHVICKNNLGKREANGDLFDSLRPAYLGGPRTTEGAQARKARDHCVESCGP